LGAQEWRPSLFSGAGSAPQTRSARRLSSARRHSSSSSAAKQPEHNRNHTRPTPFVLRRPNKTNRHRNSPTSSPQLPLTFTNWPPPTSCRLATNNWPPTTDQQLTIGRPQQILNFHFSSSSSSDCAPLATFHFHFHFHFLFHFHFHFHFHLELRKRVSLALFASASTCTSALLLHSERQSAARRAINISMGANQLDCGQWQVASECVWPNGAHS